MTRIQWIMLILAEAYKLIYYKLHVIITTHPLIHQVTIILLLTRESDYILYLYFLQTITNVLNSMRKNLSYIVYVECNPCTWIWLFLFPVAGSLIGIFMVSSKFVTTMDLRAEYSVCTWLSSTDQNLWNIKFFSYLAWLWNGKRKLSDDG